VIAATCGARAEGLWALGDPMGALRAWRAGTGSDLPLPDAVSKTSERYPPIDLAINAHPKVLIGEPELDRAMGAAALEILERPDLAQRWRTLPYRGKARSQSRAGLIGTRSRVELRIVGTHVG
jgi:hypothetical protein